MSFTAASMHSFPNLPGYRVKPHQDKKHKSILRIVAGQGVLDECTDPLLMDDKMSFPGSMSMMSTNAASKTNLLSDDIDRKLQFLAYFGPSKKLASVEYFVADNSVRISLLKVTEVNETKTLVKRTKVQKSEDYGDYLTLDDFQLGSDILIFGVNYSLFDCSDSTKDYLTNVYCRILNDSIVIPQSVADQLFPQEKQTKRCSSPSSLIPVHRKQKKDFFEHGDNCLGYICIWDSTSQVCGRITQILLRYHLSDGSFDVIPDIKSMKGSSDSPFVLKRGKLPKPIMSLSASQQQGKESLFGTVEDEMNTPCVAAAVADEEMSLSSNRNEDLPDEACYSWRDLYIGTTINIYGRSVKVVDVNEFTRRFYHDNGIDMEPAIVQTRHKLERFSREIPPPTGFGSEEDSLTSCVGSLIPRVPVKHYGDQRVLNFQAVLTSAHEEDKGRRFVIQYFMYDDTVKVYEPPIVNSGFIGGTWLRRVQINDVDNTLLKPHHFYVGKHLMVCGSEFIIIQADELSLKFMEDSPHLFRDVDIVKVMREYRKILKDRAENGRLAGDMNRFAVQEPNHLTIEEFEAFLKAENICEHTGGPSPHGAITIFRKLSNKKKKTIDIGEFVSHINNQELDVETSHLWI